MPAFHAEPGLPYWNEILSSNADATKAFYTEVMGWEITSAVAEADSSDEVDYYLARKNGLPVAGIVALPEGIPLHDRWVTHFLTRDMEESIAAIESGQGQVLADPVAVQLGTMLLAADPAGALFGLLEPEGPAFLAAGEPGCPVWYENMVIRNFDATLDFYNTLLAWAMTESQPSADESTMARYVLAVSEGAPFAGFFDAHDIFSPQTPSFWQVYLGVKDVDKAVAQVPALGGEILEGPLDSELGRVCRIADSTGAITMLCEVDEPPVDPRESDDLLDLVDQLK